MQNTVEVPKNESNPSYSDNTWGDFHSHALLDSHRIVFIHESLDSYFEHKNKY